ncbi:rhodanese-like domain-containing protein [Zobellia uliginosa]|uniref:rhodanese-like domain-containing protein n=1 Tax=Zobellia uliginosa TaxID=143224 RepID=UPI001C06B01A|nr:rhodanese-like domain-containing protein [Zobellia uliginosa]MBU2948744.1 rhodanese-like domain-containing protein [Zobellia uliginosa]
MKIFLSSILFLLITSFSFAQNKIDKTLRKLNKESVDYIHVETLQKAENPILLDAREKAEYEVSHIKDAIWVGYDTFQLDSVVQKIQNKNSEIVVYCSIGVRSENIGEKLEKAGYTNVRNLYGGIFEWKNEGLPVVDSLGNETERVHAFNKHWGKLLKTGEKVY